MGAASKIPTQTPPWPPPPLCYVVAGVSGSGKSTTGKILADRLACPFFDGDDFHPPANKDNMRAGIALTDEDRWPWLQALATVIHDHPRSIQVAQHLRRGSKVVVACSALKKAYRDVLVTDGVSGDACNLLFVLLMPPKEELQRRVAARWAQGGHFMPPSLLGSQLDALSADIDGGSTTLEPECSTSATAAVVKLTPNIAAMLVLRKLDPPENLVSSILEYVGMWENQ